MKQLLTLIIILALSASQIKAQPARVEPFADAVPYSMKSSSNIYFTNQEAAEVKAFFENQSDLKPERIIRVDDGYYHGFRLCYTAGDCPGPERMSSWIQVMTINTEESIRWFEKNNPEFLMIPFQGMKNTFGRNRQSHAEFDEKFNRYKYLACRLYRLSEVSDGNESDELSLVLNKYSERISNQTSQMLASGDMNMYVNPRENNSYNQNLWLQCLEELELVGYITMIEYHGDVFSEYSWLPSN
ncbi:MAG: hypothetical protein IPH20_17080 [Bacteroidales bacterium]|nr:hypothetical protein [Bacteroidales bacterium]